MARYRETSKQKAKRLAEEHWAWLTTVLGKIYVDSFIHGYKHGYEEAKINRRRNAR